MNRAEEVLGILALSAVTGVGSAFVVWLYADTLIPRAWRGSPETPPVVVLPTPAPPAPPPPAPDRPLPMEAPDAGDGWVPLERLAVMEGGWRTEDGTVRVVLQQRLLSPDDADAEWAQPWRLLVRDGQQGTVCAVYEGLQEAPDGLSWRLGYCRGRMPAPDAMLATQIVLLRRPGTEYLRFVLGTDIDVDIYQEP